MSDDLLTVNILGVNLTLKAKDDSTQLKQVIWFLNKKIEETRDKHKSVDQLKLSILSSIYIVDELISLKNSQYKTGTDDTLPQTDIVITEEVDRAFQRVLDVLDTSVNE
ncbi:cell division protein ZapA [Oceanispirochaeta sp.]|jgi:cell division protein ZapA (FtsZ GTPase activity inhibitor)|uniref:cell division protein ZapA n=1 Tax=Oceanispirochaeta sp. TaxID=2035350 RepID=UPI00262EFC87|nr:cell division protein ZapA [Oceanispirochaeta sp.]MDA3956494.1 cell division protein ZapA [Oceanispirochaeta sp.]